MKTKSRKVQSRHTSIESWIWDAACSIRRAKDAPKYKDFILPLIFTQCLGLDDVETDSPGKSSADWCVLLVNASQFFEKGDPKNFNPNEAIQRIADTPHRAEGRGKTISGQQHEQIRI